MRMLSCPAAVAVGLDDALVQWRARGWLAPGHLAFSPLGALHPTYLVGSALSRGLEADGHLAREAFGAYNGRLRPGFEEALRGGDLAALDWWLAREPELARRVPPSQGNQLPWLPLARVLVPSFLERADSQGAVAQFLMARGADPNQRLPSNQQQSVIDLARTLKSPILALLEAPEAKTTPARLAALADPAGRRD
jgi:hypothetical protein